MDKAIKEGQLHILQPKFGKKSWKKNWFVLYPASQFGISRLEFFDSKDGVNLSEKQSTKKMDKKIIRLSDCISITQVPNEVCPKDSMSAFTIETEEKLYTFAAEKSTSAEWFEKLCEIAFLPPAVDICCAAKPLEMAENSIYYSRSEVNEFWVNVQKTEAAERCNLHGSYILKADKESLLLKDTKTNEVLFDWPYKLMRRYGRDKVMFSFEAGRRCNSGPGNFTFETKHGNDIFLIVESSIQEQKAQAEGNRRSLHPLEPGDGSGSADSLTTDLTPPNSAGANSGSGAKGSPSSRAGGAEGAAAKKEQAAPRSMEEKELSKHLKARSLPDPPNTGPPTPPRSPVPKPPKHVANSDPASIYSDPVDALTVGKHNSDYLYSDPLDSVPKAPNPHPPPRQGFKEGKAPGRCTEPLYADIYERVSYEFSRAAVSPRSEEHIYDEPEGRAPPPLPVPTAIYNEAKQGDQDAWKKKVPSASAANDYSVPPPSRGGEQLAGKPRKPKSKPLPAPKPANRPFVKDKQADFKEIGKELVNPVPEKSVLKSNFNSSNNCIYSKVVKTRGLEKEVSVDEVTSNQDPVYEDLGNL
ncbi:docking protein 1b [Pristis pectinata]|uniref:docking protein 1b n=1 Tax=Pristis pectinata TaxID=685728 RepID=UPI00223DD2F0|nr:docking protein 1b [Pristis pectinata]